VQWPGGSREVFTGGKSNRIVRLVQGTSRALTPQGARN
jgi:hypothetical protein